MEWVTSDQTFYEKSRAVRAGTDGDLLFFLPQATVPHGRKGKREVIVFVKPSVAVSREIKVTEAKTKQTVKKLKSRTPKKYPLGLKIDVKRAKGKSKMQTGEKNFLIWQY